METIDITRDEEINKKLEIVDIKLDTYFSHQTDIEKDIKELLEERKSILREWYKKCESSQKLSQENKE